MSSEVVVKGEAVVSGEEVGCVEVGSVGVVGFVGCWFCGISWLYFTAGREWMMVMEFLFCDVDDGLMRTCNFETGLHSCCLTVGKQKQRQQ